MTVLTSQIIKCLHFHLYLNSDWYIRSDSNIHVSFRLVFFILESDLGDGLGSTPGAQGRALLEGLVDEVPISRNYC